MKVVSVTAGGMYYRPFSIKQCFVFWRKLRHLSEIIRDDEAQS
jgi:hypothetical protein